MAFQLTELTSRAQLMVALHLRTLSIFLATPLNPGRVFLELRVIRSHRPRRKFHNE